MMFEALKAFSLELYRALSQVGGQVSEPLNLLAHQVNIPAVSALLFGVMGSLAPCQMSANAGGIAYLANRTGQEHRSVWRDATAYTLGKVLVYSLLGALAILLGFRLPTSVMALLRKVFGPMMVLLGLYWLRVIRLRFTAGDNLSGWVQRHIPGRGHAGAFFLGAAYSLSFCPTMALLFFGLLVPLGIRLPGPSGLVLPALFAVGTALPLLLFTGFLVLGFGTVRHWIHRVRHWDRYVRVLAGLIFFLAGLNDTVLYWFL